MGRLSLAKPKGLLIITQLVSNRVRTWIAGLLTHIPVRFSLYQDTLAPEPQVTAPDSCVYLSCMSQLVLLAEQKLLKRILNLHLPTPLNSTIPDSRVFFGEFIHSFNYLTNISRTRTIYAFCEVL